MDETETEQTFQTSTLFELQAPPPKKKLQTQQTLSCAQNTDRPPPLPPLLLTERAGSRGAGQGCHHHHHHHHLDVHTQACPFCGVLRADSRAWPMADLAGTSAGKRRRDRRLRSWLRCERMTVQMALAEALHHSCGVEPAEVTGTEHRQ